MKTKEPRQAPLHEHLIAMGFLAYVHSVSEARGPDAPLFYLRARDPKSRPAKRACESLAAWVRNLGVNDPEVAPNHGWRHTFISRAERSDMKDSVIRWICGHSAKGAAERYRNVTLDVAAEDLKKFPRYQVRPAGTMQTPEKAA